LGVGSWENVGGTTTLLTATVSGTGAESYFRIAQP
jgi:hypothetical protein